MRPMSVPMASHDKKNYFNYLDLRNAIVPLAMQLVSDDTDAGASGVTLTESYVALHFVYFYLRNAVVPLMIPPTSHDTDAGANGISWPKKSCCTSFQYS